MKGVSMKVYLRWLGFALLFGALFAGLWLLSGFLLVWSLNTLFGLAIAYGPAELSAGGLLLALLTYRGASRGGSPGPARMPRTRGPTGPR